MIPRIQIKRSRLFSWRVVYVAFMALVGSYISFQVLDLDGSDFSSQLDPGNGCAIEPDAMNDADPVHHSEMAEPWSVIPDIALNTQVGLVLRHSSEVLIFSHLDSARDHGYRVALPRSSTTDPSFTA